MLLLCHDFTVLKRNSSPFVKVLAAQSYLTLGDLTDYIACQAPLFMGFSRQEYWSGLLFLSPRDLSDPGIRIWVSCTAGGFFII